MTIPQIKIRNLEEVKEYISELPRNVRGIATRDAAMYLLGDHTRGLKYYPARVEHGQSNPYQWQSEKQRRAYFATNGFGKGIPYQRSYDLRFGWRVSSWDDGAKTTVSNSVSYARFVMGDDQQRGHAADKWRKATKVIEDNIKGAMRAIDQAVTRWIKSKER